MILQIARLIIRHSSVQLFVHEERPPVVTISNLNYHDLCRKLHQQKQRIIRTDQRGKN